MMMGFNNNPLVLFFSRGRGRGHAMTDLAITESLPALAVEIDLRFVSYGSGAIAFRERGYSVIDLELDDSPPLFEVMVRATRTIRQYKPVVVVSHEEFIVLPASKACECPAIFITDWFFSLGHFMNETLMHADRILFINPPGIFPEPDSARSKTDYFGPVVRAMSYTAKDKNRARRELNIDPSEVVISVIPGAWATETRAPLAQILAPAFELLNDPNKRLVWVAGDDFALVSDQLRGKPNVTVLRTCWPTDRLIVASDLVITKTNRGSIMEAASLGVRTLSITYGMNPIDELLARHIRSGCVLHHKGIDSSRLATVIASELTQTLLRPDSAFIFETVDPQVVAVSLLAEIKRKLTLTCV
jgi:hypothetical protein